LGGTDHFHRGRSRTGSKISDNSSLANGPPNPCSTPAHSCNNESWRDISLQGIDLRRHPSRDRSWQGSSMAKNDRSSPEDDLESV
jgi:hypothetical protein